MAEELSNVGTISYAIVVNTSGLQAGMQGAQRSMARFSETAKADLNKFSVAMGGVVLKSEGIKKISSTVGQSLGATGSLAGNVAGAFLTMGPAIGTATAALMLWTAGQEKAAANAKKLAESNELFAKSLERFKVRTGMQKEAGDWTKGILAEIEQAKKEMKSMNFADQLKQQVIIDESEMIARLLQPLNKAKEKFENAQFETKWSTQTGSMDRMNEEASNLNAYANRLGETMDTLKDKGADFASVEKEHRTVLLQILDIEDQIADRIADQAKQAEAASKKRMAEENMVARWLVEPRWKGKWLFGDDMWNKLEKQDKEKPETARLGYGLQLGNVSVEALQSAAQQVQKVSDPESAKQTAILQQINMNTKSTKVVAVTS
jgi:hypothetical protein